MTFKNKYYIKNSEWSSFLMKDIINKKTWIKPGFL